MATKRIIGEQAKKNKIFNQSLKPYFSVYRTDHKISGTYFYGANVIV